MRKRRRIPVSIAGMAASLAAMMVLASCLTLSESVALMSSRAAMDDLAGRYKASLLATAMKNAAAAARELSPEEEYYIGRAVAANILSRYKTLGVPEVDRYLNLLGQGLALHSPRPEIFMGYRFLALQDEEPNAFASPGGHIFISRGLLRLARDEDELAAALAHEISHVALGHGLDSVQGARFANIISTFAIGAGLTSGGSAAEFTSAFGEAIAEIASTIIVSGYSRTYEFRADLEARKILARAGYDPNALARLISRLPSRLESGYDSAGNSRGGFAVTHPEPVARLEAISLYPLERKDSQPAGRIYFMDDREPDQELQSVAPLGILRTERFSELRKLF